MMLVMLKFKGEQYPFVIEDALSYSVGYKYSIKVKMTIQQWMSLYINAVISFYVKEIDEKTVNVEFLDVMEYDILLK